ncbi:MAG TPA: hypothetical protein P5052_04855 [Candidatus Paceibacterota bacterium]|nr:hypothetical protein [Candidatus Paceibacterota bacterium]HRZ30014.1 hypothetical protein [Candidatus Paceibacterota bacterium]
MIKTLINKSPVAFWFKRLKPLPFILRVVFAAIPLGISIIKILSSIYLISFFVPKAASAKLIFI